MKKFIFTLAMVATMVAAGTQSANAQCENWDGDECSVEELEAAMMAELYNEFGNGEYTYLKTSQGTFTFTNPAVVNNMSLDEVKEELNKLLNFVAYNRKLEGVDVKWCQDVCGRIYDDLTGYKANDRYVLAAMYEVHLHNILVIFRFI